MEADNSISTQLTKLIKAKQSQPVFNRFRNDFGGFTSIAELIESELESITEGGKIIASCYYHVRKDGQITIRKLAVLAEHQKQRWGRLLVYKVICRAIEEKKSSVFLKCPSNSTANHFYQKLGFELETTEQGKNQPINHWRYRIKLPLLFYCGGGGKLDGKSQYDAIALSSGWSLGINSSGKNVAHQHMKMVDNDYKNYKHKQHLEMVRKNKPLIATALDVTSPDQLPEVLSQAEELAQYAGRILIIPKCDVEIPAKYWLGYSVDSNYGSTPLSSEWFGDRPVHLLGGSPKKQALAYPQMNVVSLDINYHQNLASRFCKAVWTDGSENIEKRENGCYEAFSLSSKNLFEFWRKDSSSISESEAKPTNKESDKWYTPPQIVDLVTQVLGAIDLDPCADDGKHIKAFRHYTAKDDGLSLEWHGRVFMNPPYSCPGKWIAKLQAEIEAGRVSNAIALLPAYTDTKYLSHLLKTQPICFWSGRIKFLDVNYQPKKPARQPNVLVYWGVNQQKFEEVFQSCGVVMNVNSDAWDEKDFGDVPYKADGNQLTIFYDNSAEPPDPDDFASLAQYEEAWKKWELNNQQIEKPDKGTRCEILKGKYASELGYVCDYHTDESSEFWVKLDNHDLQIRVFAHEVKFLDEIKGHKTMTTFQFSQTQEILSQVAQLQEQLNQLTASLKPYQECEQKAEELRREVVEYGHKMTSKGIPQNDITRWAKALYSAASGVDFVEDNSFIVAAQNEQIAQLKNEVAIAQKREESWTVERIETLAVLENAIAQRHEALIKIQELEALTDSMDAQIAEQQLMPEVEALNQEIEGLKASNKHLRIEREQLEKKLEIYRADTKELDSYVAQIKQLEKENKTYQDMYEGQKAQKEQWENDFYNVRKERNQLEKQLKQINENVQDENVSPETKEEPAATQSDCTKILKKGDTVQIPDNLIGTITSFAYDNVIVKLVSGEFQFPRNQLKWISTPNSEPNSETQFHNFQEGDRVEVTEAFEELEYLLHCEGTVVGVKGNSVAILFDATDNEGQHEVILSASHIKCARHPDIKAQIRGRDFIGKIRSKTGMNNVTWQEISLSCQGDRTALKEMVLSATTKIQKDLIEKMPTLLADYVSETGDITDLGWVGNALKSKVEELLEVKKQFPFHPKDWVRNLETGETWQVRNFDGEWLSVMQGNKIASFHKSEVELVQEVAA